MKKASFIFLAAFTLLFPSLSGAQGGVEWYFEAGAINPGKLVGNPPTETGGYVSEEDCIAARQQWLSRYLQAGASLTSEEDSESRCKKTSDSGSPRGGGSGGAYELLSALPGIDRIDENTSLPDYLNILFRLLIGLTALAAVSVIIWKGITYMTTDAFTGKEESIRGIKTALWGLVLALVSWIILNTINPGILNLSFLTADDVIRVEITGDVFVPELNYTTNSDIYYLSGSASDAVKRLNNEISNAGGAGAIQRGDVGLELRVESSSQARIVARFQDGRVSEAAIAIGIGKEGFAEPGAGRRNDGRTPKGTFVAGLERFEVSNDTTKPVMTGGNPPPKVNVGKAFVSINAYDEHGNYRGIGIHGFESGAVGATNGCISMRNVDLLFLAEFMKGMTVIIQ